MSGPCPSRASDYEPNLVRGGRRDHLASYSVFIKAAELRPQVPRTRAVPGGHCADGPLRGGKFRFGCNGLSRIECGDFSEEWNFLMIVGKARSEVFFLRFNFR